MADTKISAMTPAVEIKNADVLPMVNALTNYKCTKQQILTAALGEPINLKGTAGQVVGLADNGVLDFVRMDAAGNTLLQCRTTMALQHNTIGNIINLDAFAAVNIGNGAGVVGVTIGVVGGEFVFIDPTTGLVTIGATNGVNCAYVAAVPANWALPVPTDLATAVDRLVAAVVARTVGGPV